MKNIFGDDGFRSRFGEKYLTKYFLSTFAICLADYFNKKYKVTKCITISILEVLAIKYIKLLLEN